MPNNFVGNTYASEVNFVKNWLIERLSWMDSNMLGNCASAISSAQQLAFANDVSISPNPAKDRLQISWWGEETVYVELYNLEGRWLRNDLLKPQSNTILETAEYSNGLYQLLFKSAIDGRVLFTSKVAIVK